MVRVVVGLEQAGLLRRAASSEHAKILQAHLTAKGKRTLRAAQDRVDRIHALMLTDLDPAQTNEIGRCLTLMAVRLEQTHDAATLWPHESKAHLSTDGVPAWRNQTMAIQAPDTGYLLGLAGPLPQKSGPARGNNEDDPQTEVMPRGGEARPAGH
jgi:hypothetical protein